MAAHCLLIQTQAGTGPWVKARQEQLEAEVRRIWSPTDAATDSRM
jgi:hypothetical protein